MERASYVDVRGKLNLHVLHEDHGIGRLLLADIGPGQAEEFYLRLRVAEVSPATSRKVLATLRSMLSWAVEDGLLPVNKLKGHQKKRAERRVTKPRIPGHEQVKLLIAEADPELSLALSQKRMHQWS